jgi:hypothetical protein
LTAAWLGGLCPSVESQRNLAMIHVHLTGQLGSSHGGATRWKNNPEPKSHWVSLSQGKWTEASSQHPQEGRAPLPSALGRCRPELPPFCQGHPRLSRQHPVPLPSPQTDRDGHQGSPYLLCARSRLMRPSAAGWTGPEAPQGWTSKSTGVLWVNQGRALEPLLTPFWALTVWPWMGAWNPQGALNPV